MLGLAVGQQGPVVLLRIEAPLEAGAPDLLQAKQGAGDVALGLGQARVVSSASTVRFSVSALAARSLLTGAMIMLWREGAVP